MPCIAVSSEYPVYQVDPAVAVPGYIQLLFRTDYFIKAINSMISGASGRKRVQPSQIENLEIPLPPLSIQKSIVKIWQNAQKEIITIRERTESHAQEIENKLLHAIGVRVLPPKPQKGAFSFRWKDWERWDTFFYRSDFVDLENQLLGIQSLPSENFLILYHVLGEKKIFLMEPLSILKFLL